MLEEEYYKKNRHKISLEDISTWKYFPVGEAMRKTYDYYNLELKDYLKRYYKYFDNELLWKKNWMGGIVLPLYNNEISKWKRVDFKKNNTREYQLWFEEKHNRMSSFSDENGSLKLFDKDVVLFFFYLKSFDFLQDRTLDDWINSKDFNIGGRHQVEEDLYSLNEMVEKEYGNNLVRDKLMKLEWHKR